MSHLFTTQLAESNFQLLLMNVVMVATESQINFTWSMTISIVLIANLRSYLWLKGFRSYFNGVLGALSTLVWWVFDVEFSITDYLFWIWVVRVGRSWLIYLQRESDLLIRVSYHTQIAFEKHERAPERLPWNRTGIPLHTKMFGTHFWYLQSMITWRTQSIMGVLASLRIHCKLQDNWVALLV